ncbi:MAG TPA: monovalent cation/H+ antiporter subunit D [Burkholderiales bacterium]|nr:monovalent cation/H+ antiporter subunit D [Burkholderiales bacterium]
MNWQEHLVVVPVVLPLAAGAFMLLFDERRYRLKAVLSLLSVFLILANAIALLDAANMQPVRVYALGDWPAPFGIVLVADRLSALMLLLAAVLALAALAFSLARWHRAGPRFHSLLQFMLTGLNGAFLTGDLFNLFVFFELLLAASYALTLHGSGTARVRASLHYIAINLTASLLFLIGAALIYGITGTLNMADLAVKIPQVDPEDRALLEAGAAVLGVAFLAKAGMWPLGFWLPTTYAAASAPAAALFAILSKVGVYAVLRLWLLFFGGGIGGELLLWGGMATLAFGLLGVLASQGLARLAGYSLLVSSGTLLAVIGTGNTAATAAALYYLVVSTLGVSALYLLIELVERAREPGADILAVTAAAFLGADEEGGPEEEVGVAIPASMALLGLAFACCALLVAGLPPLPGFLAKVAMLGALLAPDPVPGAAWALLALLSLSGLAAVIAMGRAGVRIFWATQRSVPRVRVIEMAPVAVLLGLCFALSATAGPALRYLQDTAQALHAPRAYIEGVLGK